MLNPSVVSQDCEDEIQICYLAELGQRKQDKARGEEQECRESFFVTVLRQGLPM